MLGGIAHAQVPQVVPLESRGRCAESANLIAPKRHVTLLDSRSRTRNGRSTAPPGAGALVWIGWAINPWYRWPNGVAGFHGCATPYPTGSANPETQWWNGQNLDLDSATLELAHIQLRSPTMQSSAKCVRLLTQKNMPDTNIIRSLALAENAALQSAERFLAYPSGLSMAREHQRSCSTKWVHPSWSFLVCRARRAHSVPGKHCQK